ITYWPLAEVVKQLGGETPAARLREILAADEQVDLVVDRVLSAAGLSHNAGGPEETAWAFRRLFEALARERPLLLVLDDVHWAEPALLDLLEYLLSFSSGAPLLVLCLARADLFETRPSWSAPRRGAHVVVLDPLAGDEARALVERLVQERELPDSERERILAAAEGNPLFVEQLLAFYGSESHVESALPQNLQALLAARIDALEAEERSVAERASVEGRTFHRTAVAELLPEATRSGVGSHLMTLVRKELIRPDRAEFPGDDGFRFGHILIRDAAYEAMPKLLRAELHERYAAWLERAAGPRMLEYEEILGYHVEQAYRLRCEIGPPDEHTRALGVHAGERLGAAGQRAFERLDTPAAAHLLGRAWELLPPDELRRLELGLTLGTALWLKGALAQADEVTAEVYERSARLGHERLRMRTRIERFDAQFHPELSMTDMRVELEHAIEFFGAAGDDVGLADAWRVVGMTHWMENHAAEAASALTRALDYARRVGAGSAALTPIVAQLASGLVHGPTPVDEAVAKCEELLALAPANLAVEGAVKRALGWLRAMQGRFDEARALMARGISILEELGMTVQAAASRGQGAVFVELLAGDLSEAERLARESIETLRAAGERSYLSTSAAVLGDLAYRLGDDEEAERMAQLSQELSVEDDSSSQSQWRLVRAQVLARRGLHEEAEALARETVALTESTDFPHLRGLSWRALADVLLAGGKRPEAVEAAETALGLFEQKGITVEVENVRRLLAEIGAA
nr:AAA family ATPase [Actinomycetota bacterium]